VSGAANREAKQLIQFNRNPVSSQDDVARVYRGIRLDERNGSVAGQGTSFGAEDSLRRGLLKPEG